MRLLRARRRSRKALRIANKAIGELLASAARLLRSSEARVERVAATDALVVFRSERDLRVLDRTGVGRLALRDALVRPTRAGQALEQVRWALEEATAFGDVGRALPDLYLLHGARIADFSGLAAAPQAIALCEEELQGRTEDAPVVILAVSRAA